MIRFTGDANFGTYNGDGKWSIIFRRVPEYAALMEVYMGLMLLVELLTPNRNLFSLFLYWQYLQMRYMIDRDGSMKVGYAPICYGAT